MSENSNCSYSSSTSSQLDVDADEQVTNQIITARTKHRIKLIEMYA